LQFTRNQIQRTFYCCFGLYQQWEYVAKFQLFTWLMKWVYVWASVNNVSVFIYCGQLHNTENCIINNDKWCIYCIHICGQSCSIKSPRVNGCHNNHSHQNHTHNTSSLVWMIGTGTQTGADDGLLLWSDELSISKEVLFVVSVSKGLDLPITVLQRWLTIGKNSGLGIISVAIGLSFQEP